LYFNSILLYCVVYVAFDNVFNKRILLLLLHHFIDNYTLLHTRQHNY